LVTVAQAFKKPKKQVVLSPFQGFCIFDQVGFTSDLEA
jgi:hypothetical protein